MLAILNERTHAIENYAIDESLAHQYLSLSDHAQDLVIVPMTTDHPVPHPNPSPSFGLNLA